MRRRGMEQQDRGGLQVGAFHQVQLLHQRSVGLLQLGHVDPGIFAILSIVTHVTSGEKRPSAAPLIAPCNSGSK